MAPSDLTRVRRFYERGIYFITHNKLPDACVNLKDALQLMPAFLPARTHLALALSKQKKYLEAIRLLEDARVNLPLRNDQLLALLEQLANLCLQRQDWPAAIYYINSALKITPDDPSLQNLLATAHAKSHNFDEAFDIYLSLKDL